MEVAANLQIGCKVQATTKDDVKIGTVAFIGLTSFAPGKWVGVVLEDESGKNNGEVQGKKYFSCPENHGIFVRPNQVIVLEEVDTGSDISEPATPSSKLRPASGLRKPSALATPVSGLRPPGASGLRAPSASGLRGSSSNLSGSTSNLSTGSGGKGSSSSLSSAVSRGGSSQNLLTTSSETKSKSRPSVGGGGSGPSRLKSTSSVSSDKWSDSPLLPPALVDEPLATASFQPSTLPFTPPASNIGTSAEDAEKIKGLESQLSDLTEKFETIKAKRMEDRGRLKEAEKVKIMFEKLQEYKTRSQEGHKDLQQQLQAAKKEARDIQEQYDTYRDEMSELQETIELSTLDKEMAEEKAEGLQEELDSFKEKFEELSVSAELMRAELQSGGGANAEGVSSYQVKQLEQQNEKLKEALVKMRDLSNNDKTENASLKKQIDKHTHELSHIRRDRETRIEEIEILNAEILDLKDQLEACLGAEEMVERLTDKNLSLEEQVATLEEEKADLEAIHEMNEELQENAREIELDMREQLDLSKSKVSQLEQSVHASQLQMADLQSTISKYRELVQTLQYENASLNLQPSSTNSVAAVIPAMASIDVKSKLSESKIQSKVIEMELLQLDIAQARAQLHLTGRFLPESFFQHGQDGDGIQVVLLFSNLVQKLHLLGNQVRNKFPWIPSLSKEDVAKSQNSERASYGAYLQCYISQLAMQFNKLAEVLTDGDMDTYKVFAGLLTEFKAYAKPISQYLDLLQKDQLYETVSTDPLAKSLRYFQDYCDKQLETYPFESTNLLRDQARVLITFSESLSVDLKRLEFVVEAGSNKEASTINKMSESVAELLQTTKRLKHCLPSPESGTQVQINTELSDRLKASLRSLSDAMNVIHSAATQADRAMNLQPEADFLPNHQINQYLVTASELLDDYSGDLYDSLLASVSHPLDRIKALVTQLEGGALDAPAAKKEKKEAIIEQRAEVFRRDGADGGSSKAKLIAKEELVNQLKFEMRKKQEEVDEYKVRAGMADKKIASASREKDDQILKLQRKVEESQVQLTKKEKEFEQTMDALQSDIDSLEVEKTATQTRLNELTKKRAFDSLTKGSAGSVSPTLVGGGGDLDSPHLLHQLKSLRSTVSWLREENVLYKSRDMKEKLAQLRPLVPMGGGIVRPAHPDGGKTNAANLLKQQQNALRSSLAKVHKDTCKLVSNRKVTSVKVPAYSLLASEDFKTTDQLHSLSSQLDKLKQQTVSFLSSSSPRTGVQTNIQAFPKPLSRQVTTDRYIGRIRVLTPGVSEVVNLRVDHDQLRTLLQQIA